MEVKFEPGKHFAAPQTLRKPGGANTGAVSFADALRATAAAGAVNRGPTDFSVMSADAVFEKAFSNRADPDLGLVDDYLAWKIAKEI